MQPRKPIQTTLGDLIVAVTDEVLPIAGNEANANALVSLIVSDLFAAKRVRLKKGSGARRR
jgi:hypothetical protein